MAATSEPSDRTATRLGQSSATSTAAARVASGRRSLPSLREVEAFVLVAELGSFKAAGDAMFLDASTVTKLVKRLERDLGRKLLVRTTRRVRPTDAGVAALPAALTLLSAAQELQALAQTAERELRDELARQASARTPGAAVAEGDDAERPIAADQHASGDADPPEAGRRASLSLVPDTASDEAPSS